MIQVFSAYTSQCTFTRIVRIASAKLNEAYDTAPGGRTKNSLLYRLIRPAHMTFVQNPAYIITVLLALVVFSEWLAGKRLFRRIGSSLVIIIAAAILANFRLIPSSSDAPSLYFTIFTYAAPLGIFLLLLDVQLKDLRMAGLPMLLMFLVGTGATLAGAVGGYFLVSPGQHHIENAFAVAGMYAGTYTGGSANLNAVAVQYNMSTNGAQFAAINAVDNIVGTSWIMVTLFLPPLLHRLVPRKRVIPPEMARFSDEELQRSISFGSETIDIPGAAALLAMGFGSLWLSNLLSEWVPQIPAILTLTTLAIVLAQVPFVQRLKGGRVMGFFLILVFLAVVGAFCDFSALAGNSEAAITLLVWVVFLMLVHGILIFGIGALLRQDWDIIAVASNANVGGTATAAVCAAAIGRRDLQLPGLLVASAGNALGTYLGVLVAELLR